MLVLAGGFGTRLRSVVDTVPKPMAPAGDGPFLLHLLRNWVSQGVRRFIFVLYYQGSLIEQFLAQEQAQGVLHGCELQVVKESTALGTGGAIANSVREACLTGSFLVANADTWLGGGVTAVASAESPALAVVWVDNTQRYGAVRLNGNNAVSFIEKRQTTGAGWINAGLYNLHANAFASWHGRPFSLEVEFFPSWAQAGVLRAVPIESDFIDIGIPEDYLRFCRWMEINQQGRL